MPATTSTPIKVQLEYTVREMLKAVYRDYFCNYLTSGKYAEHNGLTEAQGQTLINLAREVYNSSHPES